MDEELMEQFFEYKQFIIDRRTQDYEWDPEWYLNRTRLIRYLNYLVDFDEICDKWIAEADDYEKPMLIGVKQFLQIESIITNIWCFNQADGPREMYWQDVKKIVKLYLPDVDTWGPTSSIAYLNWIVEIIRRDLIEEVNVE